MGAGLGSGGAVSALLTDEQARTRLRAAVDEAGSVAAFARACGVSRQLVYQHLSGGRPIAGAVAEHLGVQAVTAYRLTAARSPGRLRKRDADAQRATKERPNE